MSRASARLRTHLFVDLAFWRHVNHDVALHRGLTAQTATLGQAADVVIALLDFVPFRQGVVFDGDAVFGELAKAGGHLTF